ncbi:MAG: hypothetical protein AB3N22_07685 [Ruegeria sp.]
MKTRNAFAALAAVTVIAMLGATAAAAQDQTRTVHVLSRTWAVTQVSEEPVIYRATRDRNNLNPYGPPARLRTTQAIAAIQKATGCRVIRSSMYQNISGQFFSQVSCG